MLQSDPRLNGTLYAVNEYYDVRFDTFGRSMVRACLSLVSCLPTSAQVILFELMVVNNWHVTASGYVAVTSRWAEICA
jgi:hypothetical protein